MKNFLEVKNTLWSANRENLIRNFQNASWQVSEEKKIKIKEATNLWKLIISLLIMINWIQLHRPQLSPTPSSLTESLELKFNFYISHSIHIKKWHPELLSRDFISSSKAKRTSIKIKNFRWNYPSWLTSPTLSHHPQTTSPTAAAQRYIKMDNRNEMRSFHNNVDVAVVVYHIYALIVATRVLDAVLNWWEMGQFGRMMRSCWRCGKDFLKTMKFDKKLKSFELHCVKFHGGVEVL